MNTKSGFQKKNSQKNFPSIDLNQNFLPKMKRTLSSLPHDTSYDCLNNNTSNKNELNIDDEIIDKLIKDKINSKNLNLNEDQEDILKNFYKKKIMDSLRQSHSKEENHTFKNSKDTKNENELIESKNKLSIILNKLQYSSNNKKVTKELLNDTDTKNSNSYLSKDCEELFIEEKSLLNFDINDMLNEINLVNFNDSPERIYCETFQDNKITVNSLRKSIERNHVNIYKRASLKNTNSSKKTLNIVSNGSPNQPFRSNTPTFSNQRNTVGVSYLNRKSEVEKNLSSRNDFLNFNIFSTNKERDTKKKIDLNLKKNENKNKFDVREYNEIMSIFDSVFGPNLENYDEDFLENNLHESELRFLTKSIIFCLYDQKNKLKETEKLKNELGFAKEQIKEKNDEIYYLKQELSKNRKNDVKNQTINYPDSTSKKFISNKTVIKQSVTPKGHYRKKSG